jgi:hypothetical protein
MRSEKTSTSGERRRAIAPLGFGKLPRLRRLSGGSGESAADEASPQVTISTPIRSAADGSSYRAENAVSAFAAETQFC